MTLQVPTKKYVYYDENGEILSISNRIVSEGNYIEVDNQDVKPITSGQAYMSDYYVEFDTLEKTYVFKHKKIDTNTFISIKDNIHLVPSMPLEDYDLKIVRDNVSKSFVFSLNPVLRENLKENSSRYANSLSFSITRENDPHSLYQLIRFKLADIIHKEQCSVPFYNKNAFDNLEISVYTIRKFKTYSYEVIND